MSERASEDLGEDKSLLLVDDDEPFLRRLAKAMEKRGFEVETAPSVTAGSAIATARPPAYAVVDLRLEDGNGLDVVEVIREKRPDSRVVVLTGYGAIATAVAALSSATYALELVALRRLPVNVFGVLLSVEPMLAAASGFLVLGETLTVRSMVAVFLISVAAAGSARYGVPVGE